MGNEDVDRAARLIAVAAVKHLEQRLPEDLRQDAEFMDDILRASHATVLRSIDKRTADLPRTPPDPRLEGPPLNSVAEITANLDAEERAKCGLLAEHAITIGRITDPITELACWEWAHDESIRIIATRRNGHR